MKKGKRDRDAHNVVDVIMSWQFSFHIRQALSRSYFENLQAINGVRIFPTEIAGIFLREVDAICQFSGITDGEKELIESSR